MVSLSVFFVKALTFMESFKSIMEFLRNKGGPWFILIGKIGKHFDTLNELFCAICTILGIPAIRK